MLQVLARQSSMTYDRYGEYAFVGGGNAGGYGVRFRQESAMEYPYLLGLLNSRLLDYLLKNRSTTFRGGFYSYARRFLESLPIRIIDFSDSTDKARHDRMVELVETMLKLHKQLATTKTNHEKSLIQRQIDVTDKQIDQLVYELYGLTDEEIKIVEEANGDDQRS